MENTNIDVEKYIDKRKNILNERFRLLKRIRALDEEMNIVDKFLEENCKHTRVKDNSYHYESVWICSICGL